MRTLTIAGLCAALAAVPLIAKAADLVLYDQAGQPVAVLVPVARSSLPPMLEQPLGFSLAGLFAQQDALIRGMMTDMQAVEATTLPDPATMGVGPGSTIVVSSFSDGRSSCSRTVIYQARPGAAPLVNVSQTGDACGAPPAANPRAVVPAAEPEAPVAPRVAVPAAPRLYQIDYRHRVTAPQAHRG